MSSDPLSYEEWTSALHEGELLGQRCPDCGNETAAPKAACAHCGSRAIETVSLPTEGTVYSVTTVGVTPADFSGPYDIAIVDLGDARVLARLEGEAEIGDPVALGGVVGDDEPAPVFTAR